MAWLLPQALAPIANLLMFALILLPAIFALPAPSSDSVTSGPASVFEPNPPGRGTVGLIISCSTTFIICIWTSVHADIPPLHASTFVKFAYKAVWMFVAIILPEGLILCALGQWLEARKIRKAWNDKFTDINPDLLVEPLKKISMEEAFFVVMGGFTVSERSTVKHDEKGKLTPVYYTSTLTPHGFMSYVDQGQISHNAFEKRHIVDKGKGSNITKAIACTQILWLVIDCATRKTVGLPLTLLEIHVVIQVVCTVVTYGLWWCKPLDVEQPILIEILDPDCSKQTIANNNAEFPSIPSGPSIPLFRENLPSFKQPPNSLEDAIAHFQTLSKSKAANAATAARDDRYFFGLLSKSKEKPELQTEPEPEPHYYITREGPPQLLPTIVLASHDTANGLDKMRPMMLAESMLTIPIGALHAIAWNIHFPTPLERWLWCGSSIAICALPVCILIAASGRQYQYLLVSMMLELSFVPGHFKDLPRYIWVAVQKLQETVKTGEKRKAKNLTNLLNASLCLGLIGLYGFAVIYITVESYISIRSPPEGTFLTPKWSNFMPHF